MTIPSDTIPPATIPPATIPPAIASIAVNGITLGFDDVGGATAAPSALPLLLVHGHPFDRSMWRPQLQAFGRPDQRVIAPDLRGYGHSSVVPGKTTLDIFAHDLDALLTARGITGRIVIGGLSMGGQIVMEFCRLFPQRVGGILLAATLPQAETEAGRQGRNAMADRLLREGMGPYADETLPGMVGAPARTRQPAVASHVLDMMRRAHPEGAAAALRGRAERPDYADVLAGLACPALVVVGDLDAFTTRADAELMHRLLKRSRLLWLEGVGHMPNLERPAAFNTALAELLNSAAAPN